MRTDDPIRWNFKLVLSSGGSNVYICSTFSERYEDEKNVKPSLVGIYSTIPFVFIYTLRVNYVTRGGGGGGCCFFFFVFRNAISSETFR